MWVDSVNDQVYVKTLTSHQLVGPIYTKSQGVSGVVVSAMRDSGYNPRTVLKVIVANALVGIISPYTDTWTPEITIPGISSISPGYTHPTNIAGIKFRGRATSADTLVDSTGTLQPATSFMSTISNTSTVGTVTIANDNALVLGNSALTEISSTASAFTIKSKGAVQNIAIQVNTGTLIVPTTEDAIFVSAATKRVGIFTNTPSEALHVNGAIKSGNILINASSTGRISGLTDPVDAQDVTTKSWTETHVKARPIALTLDVTGLDNAGIEAVLTSIAPVADYNNGTEALIHCTKQAVSVSIASSILSALMLSNTVAGNTTISVQRQLKKFRIMSGTWTFVENIGSMVTTT